MTMPTGLLQWGQTGTYDAIDDRLVITALAAGRTGLVRPAVLTAAAGLDVELQGGWLAIADAGDGTSCVVGSRTGLTFTVPAGGSSARTDVLWCDVTPGDAEWALALITPSQITGRAGVLLGSITVPANANLASQFTLAGGTASGAGLVGAVNLNGIGNSTGVRSYLTVPVGSTARQMNYITRIGMSGATLASQGKFEARLGCPPGFARSLLYVAQQVIESHPSGHFVLDIAAGDTLVAWTVTGPVNPNTRFQLFLDGMLNVQPLTGTAHPWTLTVYVNSDVPVNWHHGGFISLQPVS